MKFNWEYLRDRKITAETVKQLGEMLTVLGMKAYRRYNVSPVIDRLYRELNLDINRSYREGYTFSDAYDIVQEIICFLCEHMGRDLDNLIEVGGGDTRLKKEWITIGHKCFRIVAQMVYKRRTGIERAVDIDECLDLAMCEELEQGAGCPVVDKTIESMGLTEIQERVLLYLMDGNTHAEIAGFMGVCRGAICVYLKDIRRKYVRSVLGIAIDRKCNVLAVLTNYYINNYNS